SVSCAAASLFSGSPACAGFSCGSEGFGVAVGVYGGGAEEASVVVALVDGTDVYDGGARSLRGSGEGTVDTWHYGQYFAKRGLSWQAFRQRGGRLSQPLGGARSVLGCICHRWSSRNIRLCGPA